MDFITTHYRGIAFTLIALIALGLGFLVMLPFIPALLWAVTLSILTFPIYQKLTNRLRAYPRFGDGRAETAASFVTTLLTLVIICIPFLLIGLGLAIQLGGVASDFAATEPGEKLSLSSVLLHMDRAIQPIANQVGRGDFSLERYVQENREELGRSLQPIAFRSAGQVIFTVVTIVIALLTQFFMLRDGERMRDPAVDLIPLPPDQSLSLLDRIAETVRAVFIGTVLVAVLQGAIIGAAYAFAGVPNALLLGVISVILCIVPLLGAPVLYIPVGIMLIAEGNLKGALIVLIVGFAVVSQIDNLLKPFLIGGRINLHPMAIFFSILGGVLLIGPIGVMAGPMLLTLILALQEVIRERLKPEPRVLEGV